MLSRSSRFPYLVADGRRIVLPQSACSDASSNDLPLQPGLWTLACCNLMKECLKPGRRREAFFTVTSTGKLSVSPPVLMPLLTV